MIYLIFALSTLFTMLLGSDDPTRALKLSDLLAALLLAFTGAGIQNLWDKKS